MKCPRTILAVFLGGLAFAGASAGEEIVRGVDRFQLSYRVVLPEIPAAAEIWIPLARSDRFQDVRVLELAAPMAYRKSTDRSGANDVIIASPVPLDSGGVVQITYDVLRREKSGYAATDDSSAYLAPDRLVPADETFAHVVETMQTEAAGRPLPERLYSYVLGRMRYDKSVPGSCNGDALFAHRACSGNCSDFHSYFIALARAARLPARFAIGFTIPAGEREGPITGYHCWAEYESNGSWVPVDVSEASKHPDLAEYYRSHHPANRFELSRGRDLVFEPQPASGPVNFFVYPLLEVAGKAVPVRTEVRFSRRAP
jgi:transglutaminase-like putative cysteine protease